MYWHEREDVINPFLAVTPADNQVVLAVIGLLVVVVGAVQAIVISYYGSHARDAAHNAANAAQLASSQAYVGNKTLEQVKNVVNGQTTALLAHNAALQDRLQQAGIIPPPAPIAEMVQIPDPPVDPPTGG